MAAPLAVAQQADKVARIGWLALNSRAPGDPRSREAFLQGLRDLGYVEGRNLLIEYRDAEGKPDRFPALAAELVALKVDVIATAGGSLAAVAAKRATTTLPIVFHAVGDRSGRGSSPALRGRAAMSRACPSSRRSSSASRWNSSSRPFRGRAGSPFS